MKKPSKKQEKLEIINPNAAGIDIGSASHFVSISPTKDEEPIREYSTTTNSLKELVEWLKQKEITTVAMESTGIYWITLYDMLESAGIEVYLVNPQYTKHVSGRKSDVSDCEWIRQLHSYGLLSRSFIPDELIREFRCYVRQRETMETMKARDLQRIGKILHMMNIKLQNMVSDIEGVTSMKIIREIVSGVHDAHELSRHWNKSMKSSRASIAESLEGNYKEENIFLLEQALSSYDFHLLKMHDCDKKIEEVLIKMSVLSGNREPVTVEKIVKQGKKKCKSRKNEFTFNSHHYLQMITGVNLLAVDGFDVNTILTILSEVGTDLSKWQTSKQFISWLRLCPNAKISGGKIIGYNNNKTSNRATRAFRLAAYSLHSSNSSLGSYYRKICIKRGSRVALKAVARKLAIIFYNMMTKKVEYTREYMDDIDSRRKAKMLLNLKIKAKRMGYIITKSAA